MKDTVSPRGMFDLIRFAMQDANLLSKDEVTFNTLNYPGIPPEKSNWLMELFLPNEFTRKNPAVFKMVFPITSELVLDEVIESTLHNCLNPLSLFDLYHIENSLRNLGVTFQSESTLSARYRHAAILYLLCCHLAKKYWKLLESIRLSYELGESYEDPLFKEQPQLFGGNVYSLVSPTTCFEVFVSHPPNFYINIYKDFVAHANLLLQLEYPTKETRDQKIKRFVDLVDIYKHLHGCQVKVTYR